MWKLDAVAADMLGSLNAPSFRTPRSLFFPRIYGSRFPICSGPAFALQSASRGFCCCRSVALSCSLSLNFFRSAQASSEICRCPPRDLFFFFHIFFHLFFFLVWDDLVIVAFIATVIDTDFSTPPSIGHPFEAEAEKDHDSGRGRQGLHVPPQGPRGPPTGRESHAALRTGAFQKEIIYIYIYFFCAFLFPREPCLLSLFLPHWGQSAVGEKPRV